MNLTPAEKKLIEELTEAGFIAMSANDAGLYDPTPALSDFETVLVEFIQCWYGSYSYRNVFFRCNSTCFLRFYGGIHSEYKSENHASTSCY